MGDQGFKGTSVGGLPPLAGARTEDQYFAGDGALYYAKGSDVWKRPVEIAREAGKKTISLGFKVCTVTDVVGDEGAETVAALLTMAERYQERGEVREPMGCPLPGACACPTADHLLHEALAGIADDYMTSEAHHPGHVLIPVAKFEALCAAASTFQPRGPQNDGESSRDEPNSNQEAQTDV